MKTLSRGYSLIELMVVVAIVGIISAIAYPSYQSYTCDTFVAQAVADMRVCSLRLEQYYSDGFTYVGATIDATTSSRCSNQSPADSAKKFDITLPLATVSNYTIRATPATGQSCGGTMELSADGALTTL